FNHDMAAQVHHGSNRAKTRATLEKKVVFKSVLDSPFRIPWPSVPMNVQNRALACIMSLLDGVADYQASRMKQNRKRKRAEKQNSSTTKPASDERSDIPMNDDLVVLPEDSVLPPEPLILSHLVVGINEVTRRLDEQIRSLRQTTVIQAEPSNEPSSEVPKPIRLILVCRADVDPPILIDHIPHEVAAFNSACPAQPIKVVPLPAGTELELAKALHVRRAAIVALDCDAPRLAEFASILESLPIITAPWLTSTASAAPARPAKQLIPTHVKQLRTTTPKDMKMAKLVRSEGRAAAKAKAKEAKLNKKKKEVL
ncbi:unnamed protein product, partial [Mycena citricolor]